jgi:cell division protein YceG involved in septum cleavage
MNRKTTELYTRKNIYIALLLVFVVFGLMSYATIKSHNQESRVSFYLNLANPSKRYVSFPAGLRKEQIARVMSDTFDWTDADVRDFLTVTHHEGTVLLEGYYAPGGYWFNSDVTGAEVSEVMYNRFLDTLSTKVYGDPKISKQLMKGIGNKRSKVSVDQILSIASLIQREAAGSHDMRLISGVIWNRLEKNWNLDIDASLQYAKGSSIRWWPMVKGADKKINSPYNTYLNPGIPPAPIANPSPEAILAAVNPEKTSCMFYLHDKKAKIHCAETYLGHKLNIAAHLRPSPGTDTLISSSTIETAPFEVPSRAQPASASTRS